MPVSPASGRAQVQPIVPHQKQYVLGPARVAVRPDWKALQISPDLWLSHCPKLPILHLTSEDGVKYWLIGHAVLCDAAMSVADAFQHTNSSDVTSWTARWAGHWVLVSDRGVLPDASGSISTYYRADPGGLWISSSAAILGSLLPGLSPAKRIPWGVQHRVGWDWIPTPLAGREGVGKLLPLRSIDPRSGAIRLIELPALAEPIGEENALEQFCEAFSTIISNVPRLGHRRCLVSLTAGLDTRTILACVVGEGMEADTYTMQTPQLSRHDRELSPRLAAAVGREHSFVQADLAPEDVRDRLSQIAEHTDGEAFDMPPLNAARGFHEFAQDPDTLVLLGTTFELGRCFYDKEIAKGGLPADLQSTEALLAGAFPSPPEPYDWWLRAVHAWLEGLSDALPLRLEWRDRFYLEQRLAGWHAANQHVWDLVAGSPFFPSNCLWLFHLMLQFDPEKRKQGFAQREAIRRMAPQLAGYPFNSLPPRKPPPKPVRIFRRMIGRERYDRLMRVIRS
jgi:hypothetical protein